MDAFSALGPFVLGVSLFGLGLPMMKALGDREAESERGPVSASWVRGAGTTMDPDPLEPNPWAAGDGIVNFGSMAMNRPGFCLGFFVYIALMGAGGYAINGMDGKDGVGWYLCGLIAGCGALYAGGVVWWRVTMRRASRRGRDGKADRTVG